jgi:hypothetical protein
VIVKRVKNFYGTFVNDGLASPGTLHPIFIEHVKISNYTLINGEALTPEHLESERYYLRFR